jgi:hypothetical protein
MKYAVQTGSGAMINKPSFIKTDTGIRMLIGGDSQTCRHTDNVEIAKAYFRKVG